ncbi:MULTISPECIES: hypothetical protein [unclassified Sphingomonas]|uniref:hypothetical protein n=1 Tax=unclassified Sphingomonas TaxID=196159 RepID=UPI00226BAB17|nr:MULTISPECIES: hypothetical protein [unclassified Sphingomonas]
MLYYPRFIMPIMMGFAVLLAANAHKAAPASDRSSPPDHRADSNTVRRVVRNEALR